jgi:hypothetical protein
MPIHQTTTTKNLSGGNTSCVENVGTGRGWGKGSEELMTDD